MYYLKRKPKKAREKAPKERKPSVQTLVRKLDKVFSEYIRLRDSKPYNFRYFRCISCGQIKPYEQMDCGHFIGRTHMATRFDEENCHGECRMCLTPDALILTEDLRWVPLGDIKEGDALIGFTENGHGKSGKRRSWEKSIVTHIHREIAPVYDVELENGDHIKTTAEHKWLVHSREGYKWTETQGMWVNGHNPHGQKKTGPHTSGVTTIVCKPFLVCHREESYDAGWLDINKLGEVRSKYNTKVRSITPCGEREIVVMETSTHTFIANGYMMHNCNRFSADHMIYYQRNLEHLIGRDRLDLLIARGKSTKKWTAWELQILITHYTEEVRKLTSQ